MRIALIATWLLSIVDGTIPTFWLFVHPFVGWWRKRTKTALFGLALVWMALWAAAALATWPLLFRTLYHGWWTWLVGSCFWALGLRVYGAGMRGFTSDQLFGRPEFRPATAEQALVITGVRSRLRHPIYAGHLCLLLGNALGSGLIANYLLLACFLITLPLMLHFEERELIGRFGEAYRDYKARVPAIIPHL